MAAASSSTAPPAAETPAAPTSSTSEPLPSAARPRRRCRVREVSSRYLSTPLPSPSPRLSTSSLHSSTPLTSPSLRLSTSSFHSAKLLTAPSPRHSTSSSSSSSSSSSHSSTPSARAHHHCMPAAAFSSSGLADENRPPPATPGSRKRGAARDLFEEMHCPRLDSLAPLATATPGPVPRRILCPSSRASPNITTAARRHRKGCARPSTPARTSFSFYSASPEASAAAIVSRAAAPCPRLVPFPELKSPPGITEGPGRPPNPFCFQALASALPNCKAKIPAAAVKPALPPARKVVVVKKGSAMKVMGGSKAAGKQEDVHKLRILDNCYMQYRFLNAQAEAVAKSKKVVAEESLYGLSEKIANLQKSVAQKKAELECLKRTEKVDFVVDAQVPSLQHWCELERVHMSCLESGTTAFLNAASRVPILGNIKINTGEVRLALNSAMEIMKQLSPCAEKLSRKVEEIEDVASELNNVVSNEQVLLQECADLLHQAHDMQAMEHSLRIHVMQLKNQTKNKT